MPLRITDLTTHGLIASHCRTDYTYYVDEAVISRVSQ